MVKTKTSQPTSTELLQQADSLRRQAEDLKRKEIPDVVARMKEAIKYYGLTAQDLGLANGVTNTSSRSKAKASVAKGPTKKASVVKYRDATGNTWSGFGPKPRWFKEALAAGATEASLKAASAA